MCGLGIGLGLRLGLVLQYIQRFTGHMVSFTYVDLVVTVMATSSGGMVKMVTNQNGERPKRRHRNDDRLAQPKFQARTATSVTRYST